jgi:hypothetical protein
MHDKRSTDPTFMDIMLVKVQGRITAHGPSAAITDVTARKPQVVKSFPCVQDIVPAAFNIKSQWIEFRSCTIVRKKNYQCIIKLA